MNEIFSSRFSSEFVFRTHSAIPWGSFCGLLTVTVLIFFFVVFINYCLGIHFFRVYSITLCSSCGASKLFIIHSYLNTISIQ